MLIPVETGLKIPDRERDSELLELPWELEGCLGPSNKPDDFCCFPNNPSSSSLSDSESVHENIEIQLGRAGLLTFCSCKTTHAHTHTHRARFCEGDKKYTVARLDNDNDK